MEERVLQKRNKQEPKQKRCERDEECKDKIQKHTQSDVADFSPEFQKRIITLMEKKASNYRTKVCMRYS